MFPVIEFAFFSPVPVSVSDVSLVNAGAEHRGQQQRGDCEHDDAREGQPWALQAACPWIAVLP